MMPIRKPRFWNDLRSDWTSRVRREADDARARGEVVPEETQRQSEALAHLRRIMPDLYFVNTPAPHMVRHWGLLQQLSRNPILLDFHRHEGARLTNLTVCAIDGVEPGLLSKVCGTLSAFDIDVRSALIYTAQAENLANELTACDIEYSHEVSSSTRGIVLDTLVLSEDYYGRERALSAKTQEAVQNELRRVLSNETTVTQLLMQRRHRPCPPLFLLNITASPGIKSDMTLISLRARDNTGVLYRTSATLASLGLNIHIAQINTHDGITEDLFFVSDAEGKTLDATSCESLVLRLRAALERLDVPAC